MGLKYLYPTDGTKSCSAEPLKVKLDGKHVGEIRKVKDGFQYYPKGQKTGSIVFGKISDVQKSLALSIQPAKNKKADSVEDDSDKDEIMEQAKKGLKKLEKENKALHESLDTVSALLISVNSLLSIQAKSKETVNLLEKSVDHEGIKYDGQSLYEEIAGYLESLI